MRAWRHHLRRARFALTALVAVLLIAAAVAMGLVQILLPVATHYPDFIARQLSERLQRPVTFSGVTSHWQPSGPLLTVKNLTLGPEKPGGGSVTLKQAQLKFDFGAWLRPSHRWLTLRLNGIELRVEHSMSGWQVVGFGNSSGETHAPLQSLPVDLDLSEVRVDIVDKVTGRSWRVLAPRLRVVNIGDSVRFGGSLQQLGTRQSVTVSGRMDASERNYDLYVTTSNFDLAEAVRGLDLKGYAVRNGLADIEIWGHWRDGQFQSAAVRYAMRDLVASGPQGRSVTLAALAGRFEANHVADGWDIAWRGPGKPDANIDQAGGAIVHVRGHAGAWRVSAAARAIDLSPWLTLAAMAPQAPETLIEWAAQAQPHARLDAAALAWREGGRYDATVRFSGLQASPTDKIPGIALARGIVRADNEALSLELPPQNATLALTNVFRKPFQFRQLGGSMVAWRENGLWNIAADGLHFDTGGFAGNGEAHLILRGDGHKPFISASGALEHGTITDASMFWPYRSMPASLIAWLDHAFVGGEVTAGRVVVRGNLDDWPFLDHEGRFEATGAVQDATFDFSDEWPRATGVDAALDFVDNHMAIVATHATVQGVTTTHAVAEIPDLHHGVLGLDIQGGGTGAELLNFVRHSPVGTSAKDVLEGLKVGGKAKFGIRLSIPLDQAENFTLDGKVDLANADVTAAKWNLALKNLTGPLFIDNKGFRAQNLSAMFRGAPAKLSMAVGGNAVNDPKDMVEASMDTTASAQALVQGYPDLSNLVEHASGAAPFHIAVRLVNGGNNAPATTILNVKSTLAGLALDLPAPLNKPADTTLPLDLTLQLPPAGAPLTVSLGDVLQVRGRMGDAARNLPTALSMNFGGSMPTSVPERGLVVNGRAPRLDVSGWIQQALGGESGGAFPELAKANVATDAAEVFGTDLGALQFSFDAGTDSDTIAFDGTAVKGTIGLPTHDLATRGITAKLDYLHWPEPPEPKQESGPPPPPTPPPANSPIAPTAVPPLHVTIGDLKLGKAQLGATTFESSSTLQGMRIDKFESKGADFTIQAHGDWNGTKASSQSHLVIDVASQDFGEMLGAFGFSGLVAGGKDSHLHIEGTWPGAPSGFSLAWMTGVLDIKVGVGRILAVKPGLGRLLGLLSLRELPSRLMLHFGDVFKSGFGFDSVTANFRLENGSAYTRNLVIAAPAARIVMQGRTGFRARDYDLTVDVTPHVGGTLPVVGAVIGGPVGAAAGLVVQGLIGKGLNKAAGSIYRVTGTWDKPKIETVASLPLPAPGTSSAGPAGATPVPAGTAALPATTTPSPAASVLPPAVQPSAATPASPGTVAPASAGSGG
jgi:uncharacterized protein (TIGR02099 family)